MDQVCRSSAQSTRPSMCLGLGGRDEGMAQKRNGVSNFEKDTDTEDGEVKPGKMHTDNWTAPDAQVLLSADTRGATQGQGHLVHGGHGGRRTPCPGQPQRGCSIHKKKITLYPDSVFIKDVLSIYNLYVRMNDFV